MTRALLPLLGVVAVAWLVGCASAAKPASQVPGASPSLPPTVAASPSPAPALAATPAPTATSPRELVAYYEPGLPPRLAAAVAASAADAGLDLRPTSADPSSATLYLGAGPPPEGYRVAYLGRARWVPVTHFAREERAVDREALRGLLRGRVWSWAQLGGQDTAPIELVLDRSSAPHVYRALLGEDRAAGEAEWPSRRDEPATPLLLDDARQVVDYVSTHRRAIGVIPADALSFEVRALAVDGCDLLRDAAACWPVDTPLWLGLRPGALSEEHAEALRRALVAAGASLVPKPVTLAAAGDVILGRRVDARMVGAHDYLSPFRSVAAELGAADVAVANLETPLSDRVRPSHDPQTFTFATARSAVAGLRSAGLDAVSLANNHSFNCGPGPFVDTLETLAGAGIRPFGGGRTRDEAHRPAIVEANGLRFAFLGYDDVTGSYYAAGRETPGLAPLDLPTVQADIRAAREVADVVVPYFHWGTEYTLYPTARQREVARAAVDAGAALVLGSHPHWVQSVEFYRGAFIAYSLGNFVFDQSWSLETQQGVIVRSAWANGVLVAVDLLPVHIYDEHQPRLLRVDQGEGRDILRRVLGASGEHLRAP